MTPLRNPLVFPVGHNNGVVHFSPTDHEFQVRIGPQLIGMSDEEFTAWGAAHGFGDSDDRLTRSALEILCTDRMGVEDPRKVVSELVSRNAVVEVDDGLDALVDFARQHRIVALMPGLGNSADDPSMFSVGLLGQPAVARLAGPLFHLFKIAHLHTDLWTACQAAASTARLAGVRDTTVTESDQVLRAVVSSLHALLAPGAICLDVALAR